MSALDLTFAALWYIAAINAVTLVLSFWDKLAAMNFWRRVPEQLLLILSILGGVLGTKLAQIASGHKGLRQDYTLNLNLIAVFHLTLGVAVWSANATFIEHLDLSAVEDTAVSEPAPKPKPIKPRRFGPGT
ncbi:MAG: DUF1294 domain-containing protein [Boseongicola sp.]|nr:MAG: DUF1294 domain-containing protein [Boseongicola sp.]